MRSDVAIDIAHRAIPNPRADWLSFSLSESEPAAFIEYVRGRYLTCLLQIRWGYVNFEGETAS